MSNIIISQQNSGDGDELGVNDSQLSFPLDPVSNAILDKEGFIRFVGVINSVSIGGLEFPFAIVISANGKYYYLSSLGSLYTYTVNTSSHTLLVNGNQFPNGSAVTLYTSNQEPAPLVAGGAITYYVTNSNGYSLQLSTTLSCVFTVSGIGTTPTAGAVYIDDRGNSFTVVSTSLSGSPKSGTITFSGTTSNSFSTGTLTKVSGTGDSLISYSACSFNGGTPIAVSSQGLGAQYITYA